MKNVINFYYHMNIENIHFVNGLYYFTYQNVSYEFVTFTKNSQILFPIYQLNQVLIQQNSYYDKIVLTKDQLPYIFVDQKCFCLLQKSPLVNDVMSFYDLSFQPISILENMKSLIRFPWDVFWIQKLDYLEDVLNHLEKTSQPVLSIFLYYMGMTENAIQYIHSTIQNIPKTHQDRLVVCHHRIDSKGSVQELYMPLSLVLDYPARDVAEYLKSLFYYNEYDIAEVEEYILGLHFTKFGYSLLFARMLYPSFFFDVCDRVFQGEGEEKEILALGERREEYRIYLKEIYYIIRKKSYLEEVRWILRN